MLGALTTAFAAAGGSDLRDAGAACGPRLEEGAFFPASGLVEAVFFTADALPATARAVLFPTAAEGPAFAFFFPCAEWREGMRCAVFLRIGFLASGAIQILPGRVRSNTDTRCLARQN
jgi:hypothetical protein